MCLSLLVPYIPYNNYIIISGVLLFLTQTNHHLWNKTLPHLKSIGEALRPNFVVKTIHGITPAPSKLYNFVE